MMHALNSEKAEDESASAKTSLHSTAVTTALALTLSSRFGRLPVVVVAALVTLVLSLLTLYILHCVHASADMYSSPSIMILSQTAAGKYVIDDFREAYAWLRHNTAPNAKVASWWDYGYQTSAMAERTVIVDNNTWNTSHIATVGTAMSSPEAKAWAMFRALDVEYVFVVFGGLIGYSGDDINKFLWMVRIGGGVYPEIKEADYLANGQEYRVDQMGAKALLNSLVYRMSYLDFAEASEMWTGKRGFDRVRQVTIGKMDFKMTYFEEAFTSHHWMMRIFRVRDKPLKNLKNPAVATAKGGRAKPKK
mmetsp:Transcript_24303/g.43524  ORF Transcript_24303/g.43524 Transcript_24303/m.43524 type:complete len:306 (-) Transcript_24303:95-1012(-)